MVNLKKLLLADECATIVLGTKVAVACRQVLSQCKSTIIIHLLGDLGAGKTTLSRGILRGLDFKGTVKSPTYSLVEPYELVDVTLYHFDLYRLGDVEELESMGIRDYFEMTCICLIEWPQRGLGFLPNADLTLSLDYFLDKRQANFEASTQQGRDILSAIERMYCGDQIK